MEINRNILNDLRAHLDQEEITLLIGPRQAGKTTLLRALADELKAAGKPCIFFNVDIDADAQFFTSQQRFVERIEAEFGNQKAYVFIDEVQRIENAGLFLKGIYDRRLPYKWIATGSGSLELKEKIAESLVGRKRNFYLSTVSIREFFDYKTEGRYTQRLPQILAADPTLEDKILREFLTYGGYPRVVTAPTISEKRTLLAEIFQGYIERDIQLLLRLEKSRAFVTLLQLMANRAGQLINYNELAAYTNLSVATLKNYIWYSEKTFITEGIKPYFRNKEKEVVKSSQYYFLDNGLRNFLTGQLHEVSDTKEQGFRFQQLIFHVLKEIFRDSVAYIHFWRTQNQAEVDFVVDQGSSLLPVEVKSARMDTPQIGRSMHSFIQRYKPKEAWIVNRSFSDTVEIDSTKVRFRPWYQLL